MTNTQLINYLNICPYHDSQRKCGHACRSICHKGACSPSDDLCTEKTVLKCRCMRRLRLSFVCNSPPKDRVEFDSDSDARWLKCNDECKQFKKLAQLVRSLQKYFGFLKQFD